METLVESATADEPALEAEAAVGDAGLLAARVEAALISAERAVSAGKLAEALELDHSGPVHEAVTQLNEAYEQEGRAFRVESVAGGFRVMTLPAHAEFLASLHRSRSAGRLSPSALETLAVVAYRQPVLRAELEAVRGAACGELLRSLMERHLVRIAGRAEEVGRPMLYGTTPRFLEVFGLASLGDLPGWDGQAKPTEEATANRVAKPEPPEHAGQPGDADGFEALPEDGK